MTCCSAIACSCSISPRGRPCLNACRVFAPNRSTYYRWKQPGRPLHAGRCSARASGAGRQMPNQLPHDHRGADRRVLAGPPGARSAPRRGDAARRKWGALVVSRTASARRSAATALTPRQAAGVDRRLRRSLRAATRTRSQSAHITTPRPGELVGIDCFYVGRLHGTRGAGLAAHCDRRRQLVRLGAARSLRSAGPDWRQTRSFAVRVAAPAPRRLAPRPRALRQRQRVPRRLRAGGQQDRRPPRRIRAGRASPTGTPNAWTAHILDESWRPAFARFLQPRYRGLERELNAYLALYNFHRAHTGRLTEGRAPPNSSTVPAKMKPR